MLSSVIGRLLMHQFAVVSAGVAGKRLYSIGVTKVPLPSQFGSLSVQCVSRVDIASPSVVAPLLEPHQLVVHSATDIHFDVVDASKGQFALTCSGEANTTTKIEVPLNFDLNLVCSGDDPVTVSNLECHEVLVKSNGHVSLNNIKANTVNIAAGKGIVSKKLLQGDINLSVTNGSVVADRLQGSNIGISLGRSTGVVHIGAVYSTQFDIDVESGHVSIGSCHGDTSLEIREDGAVDIGSLEGSLHCRLRCGDVTCHLASATEVDVSLAEGSAKVTMAPGGAAILADLEGQEVSVDWRGLGLTCDEQSNVLDMGGGVRRFVGSVGKGDGDEEVSSMCRVHTKAGSVSLSALSWAESIQRQQRNPPADS